MNRSLTLTGLFLVLNLASQGSRAGDCSHSEGSAGITERLNYIITLNENICSKNELEKDSSSIFEIVNEANKDGSAAVNSIFGGLTIFVKNVCVNTMVKIENKNLRCVQAIEEEGTAGIR